MNANRKSFIALMVTILLVSNTYANAGSITPGQQDFVDQLNAGFFLTIRDTGKDYAVPANGEGVYSFTNQTYASANSPWLLTALLKAAIVGVSGVDGGLIGDTVSEKWGDRGCAIGVAAGAAFVTAVNIAVPLSPTYIHDAELYGSVNVDGVGDILPEITNYAALHIENTKDLPGLGGTISISFVDLSLIYGDIIDEHGVKIAGTELSTFLFEDSSDGSHLFGVLATNDINTSGRPLNFDDRYRLELENAYPGVADGTSIDVTSTLLVANGQLHDCIVCIPEPGTLFLMFIGSLGIICSPRSRVGRAAALSSPDIST